MCRDVCCGRTETRGLEPMLRMMRMMTMMVIKTCVLLNHVFCQHNDIVWSAASQTLLHASVMSRCCTRQTNTQYLHNCMQVWTNTHKHNSVVSPHQRSKCPKSSNLLIYIYAGIDRPYCQSSSESAGQSQSINMTLRAMRTLR